MFSSVGIWEILLLLLVVLLVFGPKKLPEMGRSLGRGMREFKDSISGLSVDDDAPNAPVVAPATSAAVVATGELVDVAALPADAVTAPREADRVESS